MNVPGQCSGSIFASPCPSAAYVFAKISFGATGKWWRSSSNHIDTHEEENRSRIRFTVGGEIECIRHTPCAVGNGTRSVPDTFLRQY